MWSEKRRKACLVRHIAQATAMRRWRLRKSSGHVGKATLALPGRILRLPVPCSMMPENKSTSLSSKQRTSLKSSAWIVPCSICSSFAAITVLAGTSLSRSLPKSISTAFLMAACSDSCTMRGICPKRLSTRIFSSACTCRREDSQAPNIRATVKRDAESASCFNPISVANAARTSALVSSNPENRRREMNPLWNRSAWTSSGTPASAKWYLMSAPAASIAAVCWSAVRESRGIARTAKMAKLARNQQV